MLGRLWQLAQNKCVNKWINVVTELITKSTIILYTYAGNRYLPLIALQTNKYTPGYKMRIMSHSCTMNLFETRRNVHAKMFYVPWTSE